MKSDDHAWDRCTNCEAEREPTLLEVLALAVLGSAGLAFVIWFFSHLKWVW